MRSCLIVALGMALSCRTSSTTEGTAGIDSLNARLIAAYERDDAAAVAALHTENVLGVIEGAIVDTSRATLEQHWRKTLPMLSGMKLTTIRRDIHGDLAVLLMHGTQQVQPKGIKKAYTDSAYVLAEVRRGADGQWRYHTLMVSRRPAMYGPR